MKQQGLLPLPVLPQPIPYDLLFEPFSNSSPSQKGRGRPPFARVLLLKAFIYKALRGIDTLTDLAFESHNNPSIYQTLGFNLYKAPPSIERFSQFLRDTPNQFFQNIRIQLVQTLLLEKVITGKHLVMDSCPILANVRENNLKTAVANRTQKGCYVTIRLTPSIREQIDYGTEAFKKLHNKRTAVERIFSRLLSIAMQNPPVIGKLAIQNYCTIAHITVLMVALAAKRSGHDDKIRFVKSFIPTLSREASKIIL